MADRKRKNVENLIKRIEQAKYNQVPEILLEGRSKRKILCCLEFFFNFFPIRFTNRRIQRG